MSLLNLWPLWKPRKISGILLKTRINSEEFYRNKEEMPMSGNPSIVTLGVLMCSITDIQNGGWETEDFALMLQKSRYIRCLRSVNKSLFPWLMFGTRPILSATLTHLFLKEKTNESSVVSRITGRVPRDAPLRHCARHNFRSGLSK